jgi:hypothetical protein
MTKIDLQITQILLFFASFAAWRELFSEQFPIHSEHGTMQLATYPLSKGEENHAFCARNLQI